MSKRNITSGVVGLLVAAISTVTVTAAAQSAGTDGQRKRPQLVVGIVVEGLGHIVEEKDPNSFPSGHTCAAFAAGMIWLRTLPWRWGRITAVVLAALMGLSRLYVGVHYPSDVLAGAIIGALCAWAAWRAYEIVEDRRNRVY